MESKLNYEALEDYSRKLADKILNSSFSNKSTLNGQDLLKISTIQQINLFLIFKLLRNWRKESEKVESPYFNYDAEEVKAALKQFMNILSNHISVGRNDLEPICIQSVENALMLVISPYNFYKDFITEWEGVTIRLNELKELKKYVRINQGLLASYLDSLEAIGTNEFSKEDGLKLLDEVFEQTDQIPEDIDPYVHQFSQLLELNISEIYGEEPERQSMDSNEVDTEQRDPEVSVEIEKPILNDQLSESDRPTLADLHKKSKIDSIKNHLSINQKFMFVNQLFDGNMEDFNKVVDFLDNCGSQSEAMDFINVNYLKKSSWKKDSSEVKEFIEVVAKKYA